MDTTDPSFQTSLIGKKSIMEVTIINDDGKYILSFEVNNKLLQRSYEVNHSAGYNIRMNLTIDLLKVLLVFSQYSSTKVTNT